MMARAASRVITVRLPRGSSAVPAGEHPAPPGTPSALPAVGERCLVEFGFGQPQAAIAVERIAQDGADRRRAAAAGDLADPGPRAVGELDPIEDCHAEVGIGRHVLAALAK